MTPTSRFWPKLLKNIDRSGVIRPWIGSMKNSNVNGGLEAAHPELEPSVVIQVEEHVQTAYGVEAVLDRDEVAEFLGDVAAEHEPLSRESEAVVDRVLATLQVAAVD